MLAAAMLAGCGGAGGAASDTGSPVTGAAQVVAPVTIHAISHSIGQGADAAPVRGLYARVNVADPRCTFVVTPPTTALPGDPSGTEAHLESTLEFAREQWQPGQSLVAINANYFGGLGNDKSDKWTANRPVDIIGLAVSNGKVVSSARSHGGIGDPALLIFAGPGAGSSAGRRAEIRYVSDLSPNALPRLEAAIAGIGSSDTDKFVGGLLVTGGVPCGHLGRVDPLRRHPRTAVGVAEGGRVLILAVVDGRQPGWSIGATLAEMAIIMADLGCTEAINLDGGGSSAFVTIDTDGTLVANRPSDTHFRPVANSILVKW